MQELKDTIWEFYWLRLLSEGAAEEASVSFPVGEVLAGRGIELVAPSATGCAPRLLISPWTSPCKTSAGAIAICSLRCKCRRCCEKHSEGSG